MLAKNNISAIILAAGKSSRMGGQKMLLPWGSRTVLGQVIWTIRAAGVEDLVAVIGGAHELVGKEAQRWGARSVFNPDYAQGEMLSSIQSGLLSLPEATQACLIALGDNPQVEAEVVQNLIDCLIGAEVAPQILIPSYQMRRGHPWIIHKNLWSEILTIRPPETMREFFRKSADKIQYLVTDSSSILKDLDTPEDYDHEKPVLK
jgi:molybdenum cofactor cytidylyltransferase